MKMGENIKMFREKKGLTQKQLGEKISVTAVTITRYENENRRPNVKTLTEIAKVLNVDINDLLDDEAKLSYEVKNLDLIEELLNSCGHSVELNQISDEELEMTIMTKTNFIVTLSLQAYENLFESVKNFIDFELYNISKK